MIDSFEIENFRGFYGRKRIAFAKPNNEIGSGLTVLVGPNNSGKTTIIDGLRLLSRNAAPIDIEHRHEGYRVRLVATDSNGRSKTLTNPDLGAITAIEGDALALPCASCLLEGHGALILLNRKWIQEVIG